MIAKVDCAIGSIHASDSISIQFHIGVQSIKGVIWAQIDTRRSTSGSIEQWSLI